MPACWPTVVERSAGVMRMAMRPDDTAPRRPIVGSCRSGSTTCPASRCSTARRRFTACPRSRRRSAAASTSGSSARTCCRSRSAATSCATWSSSSARRWPTAPTRSSRADGAGPTTAGSRRRPARGPGSTSISSCPVRRSSPPRPGVAPRRSASGADGPPARHRRADGARDARSARSSRTCGRRVAGRTSSASAGPGRRRVRPGRWPRSRRSTSSPRPACRRTRSSCRRRRAGPRPGLLVAGAASGRIDGRGRRASSSPARGRAPARDRGDGRGPGGVRRRAPRRAARRHRARRLAARRRLRRPTDAADEATRLLARTEGILVDPIYTAKALAGADRARPRRARWTASGRVLARRRHARPVRAPDGADPALAGLTRPADRHASRSFIRPPVWRTAPE